MPLDGCAFVCWILAACSVILYWYAWRSGSAQVLIPAAAMALTELLLCAYVLIVKYSN